MRNPEQFARFEKDPGFIAALDQSGGSTPKALRAYGVDDSQYSSEAEMFDIIHTARTRIITSPVFTSDRILGAILFEGTLDREIDGRGAADYLWSVKHIVPFLKIDKGLSDRHADVQLMRDIPDLDALLAHAVERGAFGTKERSVIHGANREGIEDVVEQQFDLAHRVLDAGLMPIIEPEVSIEAEDKQDAERRLVHAIVPHLDHLGEQKVALKLTLPTVPGFYADLIAHPNVARVVALSGGYDRDEANLLLAQNPGLIASFSRALLEGLSADQGDDEFDRTLNTSIEAIYRASLT
ncbi:fructose bisphosphate aldolase [Propioniciclava flava]